MINYINSYVYIYIYIYDNRLKMVYLVFPWVSYELEIRKTMYPISI